MAPEWRPDTPEQPIELFGSAGFHMTATLSVDEAARLLGLSRASTYRAVHRGELPCIRIGRRLLIVRGPLERLLNGEALDGDEPQTSAAPAEASRGRPTSRS